MSSKLFKYGLFFGCVPTPLLLALHPWTHHKYDTAKSDQQRSYNNFAPIIASWLRAGHKMKLIKVP